MDEVDTAAARATGKRPDEIGFGFPYGVIPDTFNVEGRLESGELSTTFGRSADGTIDDGAGGAESASERAFAPPRLFLA